MSCPHWGSNLTVQPVASHYTVYSIPSPSHTEGDGMSMACRRGKIKKITLHEDLCDTYFAYAF